MQISIDTDNLSNLDITILDFILNEVSEPATEPEPTATPPKTTKPKVVEAKSEPVAEPEEDLLGTDEPAPTMSDAVAAATNLVSSGQAAKVKAALAGLDAKRVSEIKDEDITKFLAALKD